MVFLWFHHACQPHAVQEYRLSHVRKSYDRQYQSGLHKYLALPGLAWFVKKDGAGLLPVKQFAFLFFFCKAAGKQV